MLKDGIVLNSPFLTLKVRHPDNLALAMLWPNVAAMNMLISHRGHNHVQSHCQVCCQPLFY